MKTQRIFGITALATLIAGVFFDGMSDGIRNNHNSSINWHLTEVLSMLFYLMAVCAYIGKELIIRGTFNFIEYSKMCCVMLFYFALMRFALFDYVHNYFFDVNMLYVGNTAFLDRIYLTYIVNFFPPTFLLMFRFAIFTFLTIIFIRTYKESNYDRKIRN